MRAVIVQARIGSTRLPGKVMLPLNGHTVLAEVLARCGRIRADSVRLTIPDSGENDALEAEGKRCGVEVYRGPEHDVLRRYYLAASGADQIMRITADCPLLCPDLCSDVFDALAGHDYASNIEPRTFAQGYDCEAFTYQTLDQANTLASVSEREHVTTWMRRADIRRVNVANKWKMDGRLTLDTEDDYKVICAGFGCEPYQHLQAA